MYELIEKYLKGTCTPAEEAHLLYLFKEYGYSLEQEDVRRALEKAPAEFYPDEKTSDKMHDAIYT